MNLQRDIPKWFPNSQIPYKFNLDVAQRSCDQSKRNPPCRGLVQWNRPVHGQTWVGGAARCAGSGFSPGQGAYGLQLSGKMLQDVCISLPSKHRFQQALESVNEQLEKRIVWILEKRISSTILLANFMIMERTDHILPAGSTRYSYVPEQRTSIYSYYFHVHGGFCWIEAQVEAEIATLKKVPAVKLRWDSSWPRSFRIEVFCISEHFSI